MTWDPTPSLLIIIQFIIHHNDHNDDDVHYGQNNKMEIQRGIVLMPPRATKLSLNYFYQKSIQIFLPFEEPPINYIIDHIIS